MTPSIPIFRNEINALGNFREGVNIASEFTVSTAALWNLTTAPHHSARLASGFAEFPFLADGPARLTRQ